MTDVSKGVWLGKNQKEVADKLSVINSDKSIETSETITAGKGFSTESSSNLGDVTCGSISSLTTGSTSIETGESLSLESGTSGIDLNGGSNNGVFFGSDVFMGTLPTSNPANAGQLWNDSGTVKISAG